MTVVVIFDEDLDNKTVKQVDTENGKKVGTPGAEIEVLDSYETLDTDTHYYVKENKHLKHVETGAVWAVQIAVLKERGTPRNEEIKENLYLNSTVNADSVVFSIPQFKSAHDGAAITAAPLSQQFSSSDYETVEALNTALANQKYIFNTEERFAQSEGYPKILATTFEVTYPRIVRSERNVDIKLLNVSNTNLGFEAVNLGELNKLSNLYNDSDEAIIKCRYVRQNGTASGESSQTVKIKDLFAGNVSKSQFSKWNEVGTDTNIQNPITKVEWYLYTDAKKRFVNFSETVEITFKNLTESLTHDQL